MEPVITSGDKSTAELKKLRRNWYKIQRAALERLFKIWLKKYAPLRFKRNAINKYKNLQKSYKRKYSGQRKYQDKYLNQLAWRIREGKDTPEPLVSSGNLQKLFIDGSYKITASRKYGAIKVTWIGLPKAATKRRAGRKIMDINIPQALTEVTDQEAKELGEIYDRLLQKEINRVDHKTSKGRGRIFI